MDFIDRLPLFPWSFWLAMALTVGVTILLVCSRIAEAEERSRPGRTAGLLHGKKARHGSATENRILLSDGDATLRPVTGRLLECSLTAVALQAADGLDRGTVLSWRPADAPSNFGWAVVEVKDATQDGRYWKLSCRFIRTPPWVTRYLGMSPPSPDPSLASAGKGEA